MQVNTVKDIVELNNLSESAPLVEVRVDRLPLGLWRNALRVASRAVSLGGQIKVLGFKKDGFGFDCKLLKRWQIMKFIALNGIFANFTFEEEANSILLKKDKSVVPPDQLISIAYVCSSNVKEAQILKTKLETLNADADRLNANIEMLVFFSEKTSITESFRAIHRTTVYYADVMEGRRINILRKKKEAFDEAHGGVLVVAHTRITMPVDQLIRLARKDFDAAAPKVVYKEKGGPTRPYLDALLLDGFSCWSTKKKTLVCSSMALPYQYYLGNRVLSVDGGVIILRRDRIKINPFELGSAWGEAEDVDVSNYLDLSGYVVEYLSEIEFESTTNKLDFSDRGIRVVLDRVRLTAAILRDFWLKWRGSTVWPI
ncbi:hypothetical protein [Kordiimonas sp.]|uniref:hypothetical protein n=1 Tax=Kordiimonas sp. TaxID=1970157 RepID=UPI003A921395